VLRAAKLKTFVYFPPVVVIQNILCIVVRLAVGGRAITIEVAVTIISLDLPRVQRVVLPGVQNNCVPIVQSFDVGAEAHITPPKL
jgi:hypothetical protein